MWHQPGTNPDLGKPLINSSLMFINNSAKRDRDNTYTIEVNTLTYLDISMDHLLS